KLPTEQYGHFDHMVISAPPPQAKALRAVSHSYTASAVYGYTAAAFVAAAWRMHGSPMTSWERHY
ncbi:MAG: hypothetical protein VYE34_04180, partial [Pseudomonadota bacterium]|nr:hypothetical protein [Pseudomonadota bacterium]